MTKTRVFFAQESTRFDTNSAKFYGDPVFIMKIGSSVPPFRTDELFARLDEELTGQSYNPEVDFFALTGPHAVVALTLAHLVAKYKQVKVLLFDAAIERYVDRTIRG